MRLRPVQFLLLLLPYALAACTDERIVFRDRELFRQLPPGAANFIGYSDQDEKLVVCGNCHVGQQSRWEQTQHAQAWAGLQKAGAAVQDFCEACHTVNQRGNPHEGSGGWVATNDPRYHDVQCESCHGPGLTHVQNPDATQPLAPLAVGQDLTLGCGECHQGAHHPFVEEWAESGHGNVIAFPAGRPECQGCHTGEGALLAFGVRADYLEKDSVLNQAGAHLPIVCGVCHDPHSADFEGQLRFAIDVPDEERNLCMRCHHKRATPEPESPQRGPHSPEGPLLLGEAGWWPPNMPIEPGGDPIVGTHGSDRNPKLCAGCHVNPFEADAAGEQVITVGHRFEALPCVDASGAPTGQDDCEISARTFRTCTDSGCHGTEAIARNLLILERGEIEGLNNRLKALLARVPPSEFSTTDERYSVAEGARFNSQLADIRGSEVHNPFLLEALLSASIEMVKREYGLTEPSAADR